MARPRALAMLAVVFVLSAATSAAMLRYESARAAWSLLGGSLGEPDYDAAASDAAYAEAEALLPWVGGCASGTALGLVLLAIAVGAMARPSKATAASDSRLLGATVVDLALLAVAIGSGWVVVRSDPGLTLLLSRLAPGVALAWIAAAGASGRTLGARAVGISLGTPPGVELGARLLFAQPILLAMPALLVLIAVRRGAGQPTPARWLAPHLALAGITRG